MANDVTTNPWVLDTAGVISTDQIRIAGIRWVGATTAAHTVVIKNNAGKVVWASVAAGANNLEADAPVPQRGLNTTGFNLDTIASGKLYVEMG